MEAFERPYKRVSRVKALALFFLRPKAFLDMAVEHDIAWQLSVTPSLRASQLKGEYTPNQEEFRSNAEARSRGLRASLLSAGTYVLLAALLGLALGYFLRVRFGVLGSLVSGVLQGIGAGIILWATLWQLTRNLQSFGGESLPERVHGWLFKLLYVVGTVAFFVVYAWQA